MGLFNYHAIDQHGKTLKGELEAANRADVASYINKKGLILVSVSERNEEAGFKQIKGKGSLSAIERQVFFENLATMLKAGLPIVEALKILRDDAEKNSIKKVLMDFQFTLEKGEPLSTAMEHYPSLFSSVAINLTKAGEASGNLEKTMDLIAEQFRRESQMRKKIINAMIYPTILLSLSIFVVIFLLLFVVPKLSGFFQQANIKLPPVTKMVVVMGDFLSSHPFVVAGFFGLLVACAVFVSQSQRGKRILSDLLAKFPLTKKLFRQLSVYRYCWTMGVLISSGIDILKCLEITENVLSAGSYKRGVANMREGVAKGDNIADVMKAQGDLFPQIVSGMTAVGEKTGSIEKIYISLAKFYDRNFSSALKTLVSLLEPLLLVLMGGIVGVIAVAIVMPIYQFVSGGVR